MAEASPSSSGFTALRKKVADLRNDSEKHFRSPDVDQAYEAELGDQVEEAEDICAQKDLKMDNARQVEKDTKTSKKDLLAILVQSFLEMQEAGQASENTSSAS